MAKVILPFENAFATTHRFVDRNRILEEIADSYLVLMSICYDLNFSEDDLENMVTHKMKYWADLQAREGKISYPVPYEIHITVSLDKETDSSRFQEVCKEIGVKPILLDLLLGPGEVIKDIMTSSVIMSDNRGAFNEMKRISTTLAKNGFPVVREKIETIPWHPAAPSRLHQNPKMPPNCYFESHLNVLCTPEKEEALGRIAKVFKAHKSKNTFKRFSDGSFTMMVTYRDKNCVFEDFRVHLDELKAALVKENFAVAKEIVEFSVYDTKVSHNSAWIKAST